MTNQSFEDAPSPDFSEHEARNKKFRDATGEAFSKASDTARDAAEKAKRAASDAASSVSDHVMGLLNDQIGVGAQSANHFAGSMRIAADDLERESPMLAGLVRGFAHNVDHYARSTGGSDRRPIGQERVRSHSAAAGVSVWTGSTRRVLRIPDVQDRQR